MPGLGIDMDEDALKRVVEKPYTLRKLRHPADRGAGDDVERVAGAEGTQQIVISARGRVPERRALDAAQPSWSRRNRSTYSAKLVRNSRATPLSARRNG
jgi:hypothetical protein